MPLCQGIPSAFALLLIVSATVNAANTNVVDNVSIGAIAQVLPLLGVFGQDLTNYFLSQSIDYLDCIIFAVGPLGVGWVLIAAIRVLGNRSLKSWIGKGVEEDSVIERDLMSSTSPNVCELWNGHGVVRITGEGQIREFLLIEDRLIDPQCAKDRYFKACGSTYPHTVSDGNKAKPPNMSLNLGPQNRKANVFIATIIACFLQSGFFVLMIFMRYGTFLKSTFQPTFTYAFVSAIAGTASLSIGLFLCASQINRATKRTTYEPLRSTPKSLIIWVQRGSVDNDPRFASRIIVKDIKDELLESHRNPSFRHSGLTVPLCYIILFSTGLGYVAQVVGVAGLHYPTQITLFGVTLVMALIRTALRQKPKPLNSKKTHYHHEMDWLAVVQILNKGMLKTDSHKKAPTWTIVGGRGWKACPDLPGVGRKPQKTTALINLRSDIGSRCSWNCPATEKAISIGSAIKLVLCKWNHLREVSTCSEFTWYLSVDLGSDDTEDLEFKVTTVDGSWEVEKLTKQIESALSLWLFYDKELNQPTNPEELSILLLGPGRTDKPFWYDKITTKTKVRFIERKECVSILPTDIVFRKYRRNRIVGFNDSLKLGPPSGYNERKTLTIEDQEERAEHMVELVSSLKFRNGAPAAISNTNLLQLYGQHIFSAFMWAFSSNLKRESIELRRDVPAEEPAEAPAEEPAEAPAEAPAEELAEAPVEDVAPVPRLQKREVKLINIHAVRAVAHEIALKGLGDEEDAMLCLFPPLFDRQT